MSEPIDPTDRLSNILYISIPEQFERTIGDFEIDSSILLPVELPAGQEQWDLEDLSWEMIIAAMLKILAYDPSSENAEYYRQFVLAVKPNVAEELTVSAIEKAERKDFEVAEEIFKALCNLYPTRPEYLLNLAMVYENHASVYLDMGKDHLHEYYLEQAFESYKNALATFPDSADTLYHAGYFFIKNENYTRARELFRQFMEIAKDGKRKNHVRTLLQKIEETTASSHLFTEAYDYIRMGKEEEGISRIQEYLHIHPEVWNAWFLLGWGYRRLGEYEKGKEAFLKTLEYNTKQADIYNELAICLMELKEYSESRKRLSQALKIEPGNVKIISNLGILSMKEKKVDEAISHFTTVLEIDPADPIAQKYITYLQEEG